MVHNVLLLDVSLPSMQLKISMWMDYKNFGVVKLMGSFMLMLLFVIVVNDHYVIVKYVVIVVILHIAHLVGQ
jgi:hypothetical protein